MVVSCGNRLIGKGNPVFIIGEIANSHEGSADAVIALIDAAKEANVDAVKVQMFSVSELVSPDHPEFELFKKLEISLDDWRKIFSSASAKGLMVLADVFGPASLENAVNLGAEGLKIHSSDINNHQILRLAASSGLPIFLSIGGSTELEIDRAINEIGGLDSSVILMTGFQAFPTLIDDSHLARLSKYRFLDIFPVGFMDHADAESPESKMLPLMAIGAGANVIEKHLTLDRSSKGTDHFSSLEPAELCELVKAIRYFEKAVGSDKALSSQAEKDYRIRMKKIPVAAADLEPGTTLTADMVCYKRVPGTTFSVPEAAIIGHKIKGAITSDQPITLDKLDVSVAILIAVRMKSSRLKRKALLQIGDQMLIEHLIDRLKTASSAGSIVLCTSTSDDDRPLLDVARSKGIYAFAGSEDDVMERFIEAGSTVKADVVVRVTGDNPLTDARCIDEMVRMHLATNADYTYVSGMPEGTCPEVISISALKSAHQLAEDPANSEYMSWYLNQADFFNIQEYKADETYNLPVRLTIDNPEDIELMRIIYDRLSEPGKIFPLESVMDLLRQQPDLAKINANITRPVVSVNTRLRSNRFA